MKEKGNNEYSYQLFDSDFKELENAKIGKKELSNKLKNTNEFEKYEDEKKALESGLREYKGQRLYNGNLYVLYSKEEEPIKIKNSDFATLSVSRNGDSKLQHFAIAVSTILLTSDNKIIICSRDASKKDEDPTDYPLQFPCGYIERPSDESRKSKDGAFDNQDMRKIKQNELTSSYILDFALKETSEELLDKKYLKLIDGSSKIIAVISQEKTFINKNGLEKKVENYRGFVVFARTELNFDQITRIREENPPKDIHEATKIGYIDLCVENIDALINDLERKKLDFTINFDKKERKFVAEQSVTLMTGLKFLQNEKLKDLANVMDKNLSVRSFSKITDNNNQRCWKWWFGIKFSPQI